MADLAFAAGGGLPVRLNLPVPLQRPYATVPGTLTEWLIAKMANLGQDAALAVLAAMNAKYANLVDPLITQERVNAMLRELAEDVLASEGLESVITVSRLSRFHSGMRQTSPYNGNNNVNQLQQMRTIQCLELQKLVVEAYSLGVWIRPGEL